MDLTQAAPGAFQWSAETPPSFDRAVMRWLSVRYRSEPLRELRDQRSVSGEEAAPPHPD